MKTNFGVRITFFVFAIICINRHISILKINKYVNGSWANYLVKRQLVYFLMLANMLVKGQMIPVDSVTHKFKYEEVVQVSELKQNEIYDRSKNWIVRTLKSSDNAVNLDDPDKASINATGNILLDNRYGGLLMFTNITLNFKYSVYCKEGRYKVVVDNFTLNYYVNLAGSGDRQLRITPLEEGFKKEGAYKANKPTNKTFIEVDQKINAMISNLKSSVENGKVRGDKSDW